MKKLHTYIHTVLEVIYLIKASNVTLANVQMSLVALYATCILVLGPRTFGSLVLYVVPPLSQSGNIANEYIARM